MEMATLKCCELCGHEAKKRIRKKGMLVCWFCSNLFNADKFFLIKEIRRLEKEIKVQAKKTFQSVYAAVPPLDILQKAKLSVDVERNYKIFSEILADYYGISAPLYSSNPSRVPLNAIACYNAELNEVFVKEKIMTLNTALHEFYHALEAHELMVGSALPILPEKREANAKKFVDACNILLYGREQKPCSITN